LKVEKKAKKKTESMSKLLYKFNRVEITIIITL